MGRGLTELLEWRVGCESLGGLVFQEKGNRVEEAGCGLCSTVRVRGREPRARVPQTMIIMATSHRKVQPPAWPFCTRSAKCLLSDGWRPGHGPPGEQDKRSFTEEGIEEAQRREGLSRVTYETQQLEIWATL